MLKNGYITRGDVPARRTTKPLGLKPGHLYTRLQQPNFFGWATQQLAARYGAATGRARRAEGDDDARPAAAGARAPRGRRRPAHVDRPCDGASSRSTRAPARSRRWSDYLPNGRQLQFNLATQAHRSTGSAFKPITLATALNEGASLYSIFYGPPEIYITDPQCATNGGPWDVHNSGDESAGTMNLIGATASSVNTIFAQLIAKVGGQERRADGALAWGSRAPARNFMPVCAITLGSVGFTPLELTDVYATIAVGRDPPRTAGVRDAFAARTRSVLGKLSTAGRSVLSAEPRRRAHVCAARA